MKSSIQKNSNLSYYYKKKFKQMEKRVEAVNSLDVKLKIAVNAMKSCVGFEPFNGLEPHRLSEALEKISGEDWNKAHDKENYQA